MGSSTTLTIVHCIGDHHTRAAFLHSPKDALEKSFKLANFAMLSLASISSLLVEQSEGSQGQFHWYS